MDTKSRNIRYSSWFKVLAVLVCALGAVSTALGALRAWDFPRGFSGEDILALHSFFWFLGGMLAVLVSLAWLAYTAGRSSRRDGVGLLGIDRVYPDVMLALICLAGSICVFLLYNLLSGLHFGRLRASYGLYAGGALLAVCIALLLSFCVSFHARRMKRGELLSHSLVYAVIPRLTRSLKKAWIGSPLAFRWVFLLVVYASLSVLLFVFTVKQSYPEQFLASASAWARALIPITLYVLLQALAVAYLVRKSALLKAILCVVLKIKSGDFSVRVQPKGGAPFADIAQAVNTIADGLNAAVEDRVKAERMKAELVTNVSHDLRTPMTSIITYIDLLKAEGPAGENAKQYIGVLDAKAKRLKALTEDLFEAAKAASGSIKPALARMDVIELIEQGLGELAGKIKESGLDFRVSLIGENLFIQADGKLLWRVVENLLSNVFKYALAQSRVYISAYRVRGNVRIEVKNISAYEITVPAEELLERFTRGDQSRGSEGSGLGLAIAKSLVELQGGSFRIEIDGDLFKGIVEFQEDI